MSQVQPTVPAGQTLLIAVGSNASSPWGDAKATVLGGMRHVAEALGREASCSRLYRTPAFPAGAGPDFVNAAFAVATDWEPWDVLDLLHRVEAEAARERVVRWGQRTLDLDLIAMGDQVLPDRATFDHWRELPLDQQMKEAPDQLVLPHPRMQDRAFVLRPLADVAPGWVHPVIGQSVTQMLATCSAADQDSVVPLA